MRADVDGTPVVFHDGARREVGNDVSLAIQQTLLREFRDPGLTPAATLEHLVAAGYQGRKTGRGFRTY